MKLIRFQTKLAHEKERMEKVEKNFDICQSQSYQQRVRFGSQSVQTGVMEATTLADCRRERLASEKGRRPPSSMPPTMTEAQQ